MQTAKLNSSFTFRYGNHCVIKTLEQKKINLIYGHYDKWDSTTRKRRLSNGLLSGDDMR